LNRIDDVVIFNSLGKDEIFKIIDITLKDLFKRIENLGYKFKLSKKVKDFVAEKGYDPQFGARPLNRAVQKYIEDPLADYILNHNPASSSTLTATIDKENNIIIKEDKVSETTSDK
jgi:ATP-dependent Clp protease ATP-binding subunit ClpC